MESIDSKNVLIAQVDGTAEEAVKDGSGNTITATYFNAVSFSDDVLTFSRPDGSHVDIDIS